MTLGEPSEPTPLARMLGWVWVVVGGIGLVVGAVTTVFAIVVFGVVALGLGLGLHGIAHARERSRLRTARTLSGDPVPPTTAPSWWRPEPGPGLGPGSGSGTAEEPVSTGPPGVEDPSSEEAGEPAESEERTAPDAPERSASSDQDRGTAPPGSTGRDGENSAAEVEDGTGDVLPPDDRPR